MTLTSREKKLLFVLALVVILVGGFRFLVLPAYSKFNTENENFSTLLARQLIAKGNLAAAGTIDSGLQKKLSDVDSSASALFPSLSNDQLNIWILDLTAKNGLSVSSIKFGSPYVTEISKDNIKNADSSTSGSTSAGQNQTAAGDLNYLLKKYAQGYKGSSTSAVPATTSGSSSSSSSAQSGASSQQAGNSLVGEQIKISMTGSFAQANSFLDAVKNSKKTVLVSSFSCSPKGSTLTIDATLLFYGAEKPDSSDKTFQ
ncbi:MAG TPA: hypothetical protein VHR42_05280 [Clostridia bacterium]|nr:hypothetical protein [Clostridia bacterium]